MTIEEKILYELKGLRIDIAQAEMAKLGLFPVDKYKATIVDRINMLSNEMNDLFLNSCEKVMEHVDDGSVIEVPVVEEDKSVNIFYESLYEIAKNEIEQWFEKHDTMCLNELACILWATTTKVPKGRGSEFVTKEDAICIAMNYIVRDHCDSQFLPLP